MIRRRSWLGAGAGGACLLLAPAWAHAEALPGPGNQFLARNEAGVLLARSGGARSAALGGAFTALADDPTAISGNPGGLGQLRSLHVTATRDALRRDDGWHGEFAVEAVALAAPLWGGVAGISLASLEYGTLELYNADGARTGSLVARDVAVAGSYTYVNPQWFNGGGGWSGMAVEVVRTVDGTLRPGFNIGSLVPVTFRTSVAWSLEHVGPKLNGGILPSVLRTGVCVRDNAGGLPVQAALDASLPFVTGTFTVAAGIEGRVAGPVSLRTGYVLRRQEGDPRGLHGMTAGIGLRYESVCFDYAYQPFGDLLATHKLSITYAATGAHDPSEVPPAPPAKRPMFLMPDATGADESGVPEPEEPPVAAPVRKPVPAPAAPKPAPAPAARPRPVAPAVMPADIAPSEPPSVGLVPGSSTGIPDETWTGPAPTEIEEPAPAAPIPGAPKPAGNRPRMGGVR